MDIKDFVYLSWIVIMTSVAFFFGALLSTSLTKICISRVEGARIKFDDAVDLIASIFNILLTMAVAYAIVRVLDANYKVYLSNWVTIISSACVGFGLIQTADKNDMPWLRVFLEDMTDQLNNRIRGEEEIVH